MFHPSYSFSPARSRQCGRGSGSSSPRRSQRRQGDHSAASHPISGAARTQDRQDRERELQTESGVWRA